MTTRQHMTVWEALDLLGRQWPLTREKIEHALALKLVPSANPGNDFMLFYENSGSVALAGAQIHRIDLRVRRDGGPGFLVVHTGDACISLDEVRRHYPALQLAGAPRGDSPDEATAHATPQDWGTLTFLFTGRNPRCLARIAFNPALPS